MTQDIKDKIKESFQESVDVKNKILQDESYKMLIEAGDLISSSITNGGKLMVCGNGGSAADAQHLVAEFLVRLTAKVNRQGIPAITLAQDTSTLTATMNDYGQDFVFKRVMSSLAQEGDVLLAISTSGNSKNIIEALKYAKSCGIYSIGFLGCNGGEAIKYCDSALVVPSNITARIQESHITAGHCLLQYVEDKLLLEDWLNKEI